MVKLVDSQGVDSQTSSRQESKKDDSRVDPIVGPSQETAPRLKLVVSNNAHSFLPPKPFRRENAEESFTAKICLKGPHLYEMTAQDLFHNLKCDLILEVESPDAFGSAAAICHFPIIPDDSLKAFAAEDETLFVAIMIPFQMKIIEQLLLFCAAHAVSKIVIFADDAQAAALEIYRDFLAYEGQTFASRGEKTEMVISTDGETFKAWVDFMEEATLKLQQALWREQKTNPLIWDYLRGRLFPKGP